MQTICLTACPDNGRSMDRIADQTVRFAYLVRSLPEIGAVVLELANEPILAHSFLALDEAGKGLGIAFEQTWIYESFTTTPLPPQPCFTENLVRSEGLAVSLPRGQLLARVWHLAGT